MFKSSEDIRAYLSSNPYVVAPMVDHSDYPFRMLARRHGAGLCFSPMINAGLAEKSPAYLERIFATGPGDRPLAVQLAGHDPEALLKTARMIGEAADIIDLNLGCPQGIARRGRYGSFLLEEEDLVESIVRHLVENLSVPVSCKIRIFEDRQRTLRLAQRLEQAGCSLLTVHGRTRFQNKELVGPADFDIIREIKQTLKIPVIANGSMANFSEVRAALEITGCDGAMAAEALLENPALFSGEKSVDLDLLAKEYLECVDLYPDQHSFVKSHLFKFLYAGFKEHTDLRDRLAKANTLEEYQLIAAQMAERRKDVPPEAKLGWYYRYRKDQPQSLLTKRDQPSCLTEQCEPQGSKEPNEPQHSTNAKETTELKDSSEPRELTELKSIAEKEKIAEPQQTPLESEVNALEKESVSELKVREQD